MLGSPNLCSEVLFEVNDLGDVRLTAMWQCSMDGIHVAGCQPHIEIVKLEVPLCGYLIGVACPSVENLLACSLLAANAVRPDVHGCCLRALAEAAAAAAA